MPNLPPLLEKRFTNLTSTSSGDAVKEYPNLANIPTRHLEVGDLQRRHLRHPDPARRHRHYHFIRQDLFEAAGLSPEPKSYDELVETTKALTDPKKRRWAFGLVNQPRQLLGRMNDEPNVWREEGGKLTHAYETEQYAQTVTDLIELWKSGVMHPDAFNPRSRSSSCSTPAPSPSTRPTGIRAGPSTSSTTRATRTSSSA